jgi:hypothetical protein
MILSCGEALIDMLPRTATSGEAAFAPYAGGAVFNTAIALGRLGAPSAFFSGISTDMLGEILAETLTASKVDTRHLARSNRPTTVAFVKLVDGQATYAFYDENTAGLMLTEADLPDLPAEVSTLFFGGISLVNDPAASTTVPLDWLRFLWALQSSGLEDFNLITGYYSAAINDTDWAPTGGGVIKAFVDAGLLTDVPNPTVASQPNHVLAIHHGVMP